MLIYLALFQDTKLSSLDRTLERQIFIVLGKKIVAIKYTVLQNS